MINHFVENYGIHFFTNIIDNKTEYYAFIKKNWYTSTNKNLRYNNSYFISFFLQQAILLVLHFLTI